jgi:hypothetical protein
VCYPLEVTICDLKLPDFPRLRNLKSQLVISRSQIVTLVIAQLEVPFWHLKLLVLLFGSTDLVARNGTRCERQQQRDHAAEQ